MKKFDEIKQIVHDTQFIINKMNEEIDILRAIVHRYFLMYGDKIQKGVLVTPNELSFGISQKEDGSVICKMVDHSDLGIRSDYQIINDKINNLNK